MAYIGTNVTVDVQAALATTVITASGISQADPPVVSAAAHGYSDGDFVVAAVAAGMVQLDGQVARVASSTSNTFALEGVLAADYSAFSTGGATFKKVSSFNTLGSAQQVSMPDPAPEKIDITTLIDKSKQYAYGLPEAPDGSISGLYDPLDTAVADIKAATKANSPRVFKVTWSGGQITVFNANVSGGSGFDLPQNGVATANISFTPIKDVITYAS